MATQAGEARPVDQRYNLIGSEYLTEQEPRSAVHQRRRG